MIQQYSLTDSGGREMLSLSNHHLRYPRHAKMHTHRRLELSLVKAGSGVYEVADRSYEFLQGDIFILSNRETHRIVLPEGASMHNMVIHFEPEFLWGYSGDSIDYRYLNVFFARNQSFSHRLDRDNPVTRAVAERMLELEREFEQGHLYYDLRIKLLMEQILLEILRGFNYFVTDSTRSQVSISENYRINEVLHHIDMNIGRELTLNELAKVACVSPTYFSSLFKRLNGITLFEYITRKRVEHSITLIVTTSASLTEIYSLCGFNSSTSFNKAFRRITGYAPSFFRKRLGEMDAGELQSFIADVMHEKTIDLQGNLYEG